jgi:tetratricopeptide (TPR) repeat protein/tRNA A-37 threonylcarbamoyl transferase component Bud32
MGVVYRARDRVLEREVALKLIRPERAGDAETRQRFLREARSAATLNHPGIATVYEAGETPATEPGGASSLFIAEELVQGETLAASIARGPLPIGEVVRFGAQMAEALGEAHDGGIVHRDVKPSNLMLTPDGQVKILDFGVARQRQWQGGLESGELDIATWSRTSPGVLLGTPAYMPPEQIVGESVDPRADVYAAGCVLYELLAGRPPFTGATTEEVLRRCLTETPRPVRELRPGVPDAMAAVVARALERDPRRRYANGKELAEALRTSGTETVTTARRPVLPRPRGRWRSRVAAALLAAAALGAIAWLALGRASRPALAFNERDFVLVADVVNQTGEPVFDVALKSALETDLRQSRYVNVLDAGQVRNTLRMMRLEPDTRIDREVGRDLCRRSGAKALVVPRILSAGEAYQLQVALVEPATSRVVDEVRVTALGREEVLLTAIDALTRGLRSRLGESLASIALTDPPFVQYTTSSLEALELLEAGSRAWGAGDAAGTERSFRQALQHDPRFAAARGSLGLLLIQFLDQPEEGRRMLTQALEDAGDVSQREHLHLQALHKQFVTEDLKGALDDYRFIADLYPDHFVPFNNSGRILIGLGRFEEAKAMFEQAHRIDPRAPVPVWNLWDLSVRRLLDPPGAERFARTLMELLPDNAYATHALAWSLVAQRRFTEAEELMRTVLELEPTDGFAQPSLGHLLMRRGAAGEAVDVYRKALTDPPSSLTPAREDHLTLCLGLALEIAGRGAEARRVLLEGEKASRERPPGAVPEPLERALRGALLAAAGQRDRARGLLSRASEHGETSPLLHMSLARAWSILGDRPRAISHLDKALAGGYDDPYMIPIDPPLAAVREDPAVDRMAPPGPDT